MILTITIKLQMVIKVFSYREITKNLTKPGIRNLVKLNIFLI